MPRRRPAPEPPRAPYLAWRRGVAYYRRRHARAGRIFTSLDTREHATALERVGAVNTILDRGEYGVIRRWQAGELAIAELARAVREGEYRRLVVLAPEGVTLGEAVERFLRRADATLAPSTAQQYRSTLGLLVDSMGAGTTLESVTREQAEGFLHRDQPTLRKRPADDRKWTPGSQIRARIVCKALWAAEIEAQREEAERQGGVPSLTVNPWARAKVPERRTTRHEYLSRAEWRTLIQHPEVAGTPWAAFLGVLCLAGLRLAEARHLRPGIDVDTERGVIHVQSRVGEYPWRPKVRRSERDVPLVAPLRELIEAHIAAGYAGARYLFRAPGRDEPIGQTTGQDWVARALRAVGIKYGRGQDAITAHSLRHTYATQLVRAGIPIPTVARYMGNTPAMVMEVYAHHVPSDDERVVRVLEEFGR